MDHFLLFSSKSVELRAQVSTKNIQDIMGQVRKAVQYLGFSLTKHSSRPGRKEYYSLFNLLVGMLLHFAVYKVAIIYAPQ